MSSISVASKNCRNKAVAQKTLKIRLKKLQKSLKTLINSTFLACHLFRSPNTKQRTPIGVLFVLAGAQPREHRSASRSDAEWGSHSPLGGTQAELVTSSLAGRRACESSPKANIPLLSYLDANRRPFSIRRLTFCPAPAILCLIKSPFNPKGARQRCLPYRSI